MATSRIVCLSLPVPVAPSPVCGVVLLLRICVLLLLVTFSRSLRIARFFACPDFQGTDSDPIKPTTRSIPSTRNSALFQGSFGSYRTNRRVGAYFRWKLLCF